MPVPLPSQEYLRECLDYDPDTGALTWRSRPVEHFENMKASKIWNKRYAGTPAGSPLHSGHIALALMKRKYRSHRVIFKWMTGEDPPDVLDHDDTDPAGNKWVNIRPASATENKCNQGAQRNNTSGYKGVTWIARRGKWKAQIKLHKKNYHLGHFPTAQEAFAAYCAAATRLHGEFARTHHSRPRRTPREVSKTSADNPEHTGY